MRKKVLIMVLLALSMVATVSNADIVCEQGHVFNWNGWHCNPGPGPEGCLRCYDTITVGGGCATAGCTENPEP
jgi:hypothetical protein